MQKLIVLVAIAACCLAAPVENKEDAGLPRPSPINPDIPSDPKPEEKVVLISTEKPLDPENPAIRPQGPYAQPSPPKRFLKREDKDSSSSSSSEENSSEEDKKPSTKLRPISHVTPSTSAPTQSTTGTPADDASSITSTTASHRRPFAPRVHQHNEHLFKPSTEAAPSTAAVAADDNKNDKRDIPVESPQKAVESDAAKEVKKDEESEHTHAAHPATISRPIPVAELFAKKPTTA